MMDLVSTFGPHEWQYEWESDLKPRALRSFPARRRMTQEETEKYLEIRKRDVGRDKWFPALQIAVNWVLNRKGSQYPASWYAVPFDWTAREAAGPRNATYVEDENRIWNSDSKLELATDTHLALLDLYIRPISLTYGKILMRANTKATLEAYLRLAVEQMLLERREGTPHLRFFELSKSILVAEPYVSFGPLPPQSLNASHEAFGLATVSQLRVLTTQDLEDTIAQIRLIPDEKTVLTDNERVNNQRIVNPTAFRRVVHDLCDSILKAAISPEFLTDAARRARPDKFPVITKDIEFNDALQQQSSNLEQIPLDENEMIDEVLVEQVADGILLQSTDIEKSCFINQAHNRPNKQIIQVTGLARTQYVARHAQRFQQRMIELIDEKTIHLNGSVREQTRTAIASRVARGTTAFLLPTEAKS